MKNKTFYNEIKKFMKNIVNLQVQFQKNAIFAKINYLKISIKFDQ